MSGRLSSIRLVGATSSVRSACFWGAGIKLVLRQFFVLNIMLRSIKLSARHIYSVRRSPPDGGPPRRPCRHDHHNTYCDVEAYEHASFSILQRENNLYYYMYVRHPTPDNSLPATAVPHSSLFNRTLPQKIGTDPRFIYGSTSSLDDDDRALAQCWRLPFMIRAILAVS